MSPPRRPGPGATSHLFLVGILAVQTLASLTLRNTAFQDEALYLYSGRQIIDHVRGGPASDDPYSTYFSGFPYLYPVLAGMLDTAWQLEGARFLSLMLMLGASTTVYAVARALFDRGSGLVAAALFAVHGSVLFVGRLATYDALCLVLLGSAAVVAVQAGASRRPIAAGCVGVLLALAVTSKYAGLLLVPSVLALLGWQSVLKSGWRSARLHVGIAVVVLGACLGVVMASSADVRTGVLVTTLQRVPSGETPRLFLLEHSLTQAGLVLVLALVGLNVVGRSRRIFAGVLVASGFLPLAYHVYKAEFVSLDKHLAFGVLFAAPVAGFAVARLARYGRGGLIGPRATAALAVCLLTLGFTLPQARAVYTWPDSSGLIALLRTEVHTGSSRILSDEEEVSRYYLRDTVQGWQWTSQYYFRYTRPGTPEFSGDDAYRAAIADGYFDLVVLHSGGGGLQQAIEGGLGGENSPYELLAQVAYGPASVPGTYWVWRKRMS